MVVFENSVYRIDWEKSVVMKNGNVVYSDDFVVQARKGDRLLELAFREPEKVVKFFGKKVIVEKRGHEVLVNGTHLLKYAATITWNGLKMFKKDPTGITYVHVGVGYAVVLENINTYLSELYGKPVALIGDAPPEALRDVGYMKRVLRALERFEKKYRISLIYRSFIERKYAWFYVLPKHKRVVSSLFIEGDRAEVFVARDDGIYVHSSGLENLENIIDEPDDARVFIDFGVVLDVRDVFVNEYVNYLLTNGVIFSVGEDRFRVKVDGKWYYYKKLSSALKRAGVL